VLGSSVPGTNINEPKKASVLSNCHGLAGDRTVTLQCPSTTLSPPWGKSVGGVSEGTGVKAGGSDPFASSFTLVTVKGIPVFWKAALFAGRRWNEDLGRSA